MANQVNAKNVSSLRAKTGAGMMDCKKALMETQGDVEKAVDFLRTKGIAKADKRAGKVASQGLVFAYQHFTGKVGVLVEINCETDFVARTDDFQELAKDVALQIASTSPMGVTAADVPEELLAREVANWRVHGSLIPRDRLELLHTHVERFRHLDNESRQCLLGSALKSGFP